MDSKFVYDHWCQNVKNSELLSELLNMASDDGGISDRFGSSLSFGTAGARGLIGMGTNRLNIFTVRQISYSFASFLVGKFKNPSVVISYDTRKLSDVFAKISAGVFAFYGIKVHFFKNPQPIGLLSFAIRNLSAFGGVMITASHNPPEYNGYKIYDSNGAQPTNVDEISERFRSVDPFSVEFLDFEKSLKDGKIEFVSKELVEEYVNIFKQKINFKGLNNLDITYSPLNGCSLDLFECLFNDVKNIHVVEEQKLRDSSFKSCNPPDPQKLNSFDLSLKLAKKHNSDLIILNDPDGDRLGIALRYKNNYRILSGIEVAALFLDYLGKKRRDRTSYFVVKSVVTGGLANSIVKFYGMKCIETLPGFKYIAECMDNLEKNGNIDSFLMGFEESNGFLLDSNIRDKDGISSAAFFCEMVSFYKSKNTNCIDVLESLYEKFGYHMQKNISFKESNPEKIKQSIQKFRQYFFDNRGDVVSISDYRISEKVNFVNNEKTKICLPKSDMLGIEFEGNNILFVRSSGTEPLIKFYILYNSVFKERAYKICEKIESLIYKIYTSF